MSFPHETRVLIVGGGPVGLVMSGLLAGLGVPNVVVERRAEPQRAPAAHVLRRRPMEVLALLGVADEIHRRTPSLDLHFITWCATLGGSEAGRIDLRLGREGGRAANAAPWTNCPQNLLEPILLERVGRHRAVQVATGTECVGLAQHERGVTARVRGPEGAEQEIAARWAIAADGAGSPTRHLLEIPMEGQGALGRFFMVHFAADLTPWIRARSGPLFWILNPEAAGTLIVHDPVRSHVFMTLMHGTDREADGLSDRLAAALGVPVAPEILSVQTWSPHVQVAARYREGRVFLVGDAAHRFPPTGGLGLNTGILDAHNLAWKLAQVYAGRADAALLDTYETECRPAAQANAQASFENLEGLGEVFAAIGPCRDLAALEQRLATMTDAERNRLSAAIEAQRSHFSFEGVLPPLRREDPYASFDH